MFEGEGADGISLAEFVHHFFTQRGEPRSPMQNASIWHEIASWWPHRWVGLLMGRRAGGQEPRAALG